MASSSRQRVLTGDTPTGRLHLGHARSFLLAWWSARSRGGRVVLRMEDLDPDRSRPEHADLVLLVVDASVGVLEDDEAVANLEEQMAQVMEKLKVRLDKGGTAEMMAAIRTTANGRTLTLKGEAKDFLW